MTSMPIYGRLSKKDFLLVWLICGHIKATYNHTESLFFAPMASVPEHRVGLNGTAYLCLFHVSPAGARTGGLSVSLSDTFLMSFFRPKTDFRFISHMRKVPH